MSGTEAIAWGVLIALVGAVLLVLARSLLRLAENAASAQTPLVPASDAFLEKEAEEGQDAVLLVLSGGRVRYLNALARQWFGLQPEDRPSLEFLAHRLRPEDEFVRVCAAPGRARLTLATRAVEAVSYAVPYQGEMAVLVTLRPLQLLPTEEGEAAPAPTAETVRALVEIGQDVSAHQTLEEALQAVAEAVDRLVPADVISLSLWDEAHQRLQPYHYAGGERKVLLPEAGAERAQEDTLAAHIAQERKPVMIADLDAGAPALPPLDRRRHPVRAYMGVPLMVGEDFVGVLEVASFTAGAYTDADLDFLSLIAGQVAVAVQNARRFSDARRRLQELRSLADIASAASGLKNTRELIERILENVRPLFNAQILGFLLYDEVHRILAAQWPFDGLPEGFVEAYRTRIAAGSPAEEIILSGRPLVTDNAAEDPQWRALGLADLVRAAGIRASALYPLNAGARFLGFLQVANKPNDQPFTDEDMDVLALVAAQVAPFLENAVLFQEARQRAQRAEALRRIASLTASPATVDEVLRFSLPELARLVEARYAAVLLLDEDQTELTPHLGSLYGLAPEQAQSVGAISAQHPDFRFTVTRSGRPFLSDDVRNDPRVSAVYQPVLAALPDVHAVMVVPLKSRGESVGEIILAHPDVGRFDRNDLQLAAATASQMAIAIERERLLMQSDQALRSQVDRLSALTRLSRELAAFSSLEHLLDYAHQQMVALTRAECGLTWVVDADPATGERKVVHRTGGPCEAAWHPLDEEAWAQGRMMVISDYQAADVPPPHEHVRASLVLPLQYQHKTVGVVHLHASQPNHFDEQRQQFARLLGQHIATAIGQAMQTQQLLRESAALQREARALDHLRRFWQQHPPLDASPEALQAFVRLVGEVAGFDGVLLARYDAQAGELQPLHAQGLENVEVIPWDALTLLLEDRFDHQGVYFIPAEERPPLPNNLTLPRNATMPQAEGDDADWHAEDLLIIPLRTARGEPVGLLYLSQPRDARRPDQAHLETLRLLAAQAAWLLQAQALAAEWESARHTLTRRVAEAEEVAHQAQEDLPLWLRQDLQQNLDRYALSQRVERLQVSLEITALLNSQPSHLAVLNTLGQQLIERLGFNYVLVAEPTPFSPEGGDQGGARLLRTFGELPPALRLDMLLGQRNPLTDVLHRQRVLVVPDVSREPEWEQSPLLQRLQAQSFVAFPITVEQQVQNIVLATSSAPMPAFTTQDMAIFDLLGRQVGIVLQNLDLLSRTSRRLREVDLLLTFSRQLGVLDPARILNTLMESTLGVLQHAHAGFVAMWDPDRRVLYPHAAGGYADARALLDIVLPEDSLPAHVMLEGTPRRIAELDFAEAYPLDTEGLMAYRKATAERMPVSSMMVPIRAGDRPLGVIVLDNFNTAAAFSSEDQTLVVSLAQQTALTLENARLLQTAEQRAAQLHALAAASSELAAHSLSSEEVEASLLEQLAQVLPYDGGTLWLRQGERLVVRDARGFPNAAELKGVAVAIEDSRLFQEMIASRRALVVHDTHADDRFPAAEAMPNRSWLGLPLWFKDDILGVIALEKQEPYFFTQDWVETAETFAGQAAAALANAHLYEESLHRAEELDRRTRRLSLVYEVTAALSGSLDPQYIVTYTAERLHEALGVGVSLVLCDPPRQAAHADEADEEEVAQQPLLVAEAPAPEGDAFPNPLPDAPIFERLAESLGVFRSEHFRDEPLLAPLADFLESRNAHGVAVVPLPAGQTLFGTLFLHVPEGRVLSSDEIELAQTIAKQAAVALQNARLYETTRRFTEELEARVAARTEELQREHHRAQTLLQIIGELSASLDLDQVLNRTLDLLNDAITAKQSSILLARPGEKTLFFRAGRGYTDQPPTGGRPTEISATESLAGWVIHNNQPVLVHDLKMDPRWKEKPHGLSSVHRSVIGVPLVVAQEVLGALLLFHTEPNHFTEYHLDLATATAKQVAVAINNAELFRLIREQAERLGKLLRQQEVEASRARAILEAIADGVVVTDDRGVITLFNPSAARVLGLSAEQAVGKPLEHFIGLFGDQGRQWMDAIHEWSRTPAAFRDQAVTHQRQIELEDGRVVSVHLAPVFFRKDFLGTVSVFRDITHQVEVDRLKSEFVATVSHELRTPMTAIKGYVDILLMGAAGPLTDQQRRFLETVKNNTERLNILVADLLDISRIEAGRVALMLEPIDLRSLLTDVVTERLRAAEQQGRTLAVETDLPEDLPPVKGDLERVRQIAENLVENAFRYTPDGGRVTVRARALGDEVQVDVEDTGIGVPPEEQPRVFERFYRGENPLVMASAGTGLGLSIVKTLVEMHGGRIWLESSGVPGEGSVFSFTLPVWTEASEDFSREA